jgi:hypothetical protein
VSRLPFQDALVKGHPIPPNLPIQFIIACPMTLTCINRDLNRIIEILARERSLLQCISRLLAPIAR